MFRRPLFLLGLGLIAGYHLRKYLAEQNVFEGATAGTSDSSAGGAWSDIMAGIKQGARDAVQHRKGH